MAPMKPKHRRSDQDLVGTLSLDQLARRWRLPRKQIRHMLGREELGFIQVRGRFRVLLTEVERYESSHGSPAGK